MRSTYMAKQGELDSQWVIVDANDMVLGRLASLVATRLRGKHKPEFTPNQLCGDHVIIINADKVRLTGNKENSKMYHRHTGHRLKSLTYKQMSEKHPTRIVESAVKGMLPKNVLGRRMFGRLRVYTGAEHPHASNNPTVLETN